MAQKHTKGSSQGTQSSLWAPGAVGLDDIMGQYRGMEREEPSANYPPSRKETYRELRSRKASSICWTTLPLGLAASMDCLVSEGRAPDGQEPTGSLRTTGGSGHTQKMCGLRRRAWGACQARFCCISSPWVLWGRRRPQEEEGCSTLRRALRKAWVARGAGELGRGGRL